jgi:hypothetical protein
MNIYKVPVTWREQGYLLIEAHSEAEAIRRTHDADLPSDSEYMEDSLEIDYDNIKKI